MKNMNILVLGSTGNIGRQFVNIALERGHNVTAIVRASGNIDKKKRLTIIQGDVLNPALLQQSFSGMDAIVSCLGIRKENPSDPWSSLLSPEDFTERCAINTVDAMKTNEVKRLIVISSAGVGDSWESVDSELQNVIQSSNVRKIFLDLKNMEEVLKNSGLDTLAIRLVALVNGTVSNHAEIVERFEKTSKIFTGDVAQWIANAVERPTPFQHRTEMIGTKTLP